MTLSSISFEKALAELERIVTQIEAGTLSLEENLQAYARGNVLLQQCQQILQAVSQQVEVLGEDLQLTPFQLEDRLVQAQSGMSHSGELSGDMTHRGQDIELHENK